ncbi:uncharacterized protein LOC122372544 [Amphibalanus amphitrite]|uniref:uncharacterized protein LOC122372544 n=1 Tax=Amphibalanus amphitrite TaxID=1232801 RepID=UPI001C8FE899|nr:uncharacterized protein LOC122372544 [Amphibalanus amphitrite]
MKTASGLSTVDEVDAVHPRLSSGSARRRPSHPAFVCDTCSRDTSGWQDCVDHAYRSGHGLAARCALCRLPAVRCRRKGRPGVWHRCVVTDTVRKMGVGNVAALMAGSHLTAPRPWRLSCGECGAAFAAKTARLVRHVIERGHSVERHCEKCLFPVFVFALNDERREMHVCVGNSAWLRKEEEALLATAGDDARYLTHFSENGEERGQGRRQDGGTPTHHHRHHHGHSHTGLDHHHEHQNGGIPRRSDDTTSSYSHQNGASKTANGSTSSHNHQTSISTNGGDGGVGGVGHSSVPLSGGKLVVPLTAGTDRRWPEERTASCVAI